MNIADPPERPSRSQIKREAEASQSLGEELIALPAKQLAEIPLPENLRDAIRQAQDITSHGASRRQRQYVGRLMRSVDTAPIRAKLAELRGADRVSRARFQDAERWRTRLLNAGDDAIEEFLAHHPQAERTTLRRLVRDARREAAEGRPLQHARELFRYIHGLIGTTPVYPPAKRG